jgi:t-SNARE complex subunit (syntaxin)
MKFDTASTEIAMIQLLNYMADEMHKQTQLLDQISKNTSQIRQYKYRGKNTNKGTNKDE